MRTPIKLQRSLDLHAWHVTGTISFATKREWEPAVLKLAVQHGAVTPDLVVKDLLGGRSGMAKRLIEICTRLGLLEQRGSEAVPTDSGRQVAQTGVVLLPQRGAWTVWASEDPVLRSRVVAVEPWGEPSAYDERATKRAFSRLPAWLIETFGRPCEPLSGSHHAVRLDELGKEQKGEAIDAGGQLRVTLTIDPTEVRLRVTGDLGDRRVDADASAPGLSYNAVWTTLVHQAGLRQQWDAHRKALWVAFRETSEIERTTVQRAVQIEGPTLPDLGRFDATTIEHVPLRPWSKSDAAEWSEWRLLHSISGYAIDDALEIAHREASAPFEDMAPECPSRAALAERVRGADKPPPVYWRLQAPADWLLDENGAREVAR